MASSSTTTRDKKYGIICIDIERTGRTPSDDVFAVGFATCDIKNPSEIKTFNVCRRLGIQPDQSLQSFWQHSGYDQTCLDEFWSKNTEVFLKLQDEKQVNLVGPAESEFVQQINEILRACEEMYDESVILTDTTLFDTVYLNQLLTKYEYEPVNYTRNKEYRSGIESDSYVGGLMKSDDPFDWRSLGDFKKEHLDKLKVCEVEHDHHPENDAKHILVMYLAALQCAKNQKTCKSY